MNTTVISDEIVPAGMPWSGIVAKGYYLSIIDLEGQQGVDFLCYNAERPEERYHAPNTLKAARDLRLTKGHQLYSDEANAIFTLVGDSCNGHDTIGGCCSAPSNDMLYGVSDCPGCRGKLFESVGRSRSGAKRHRPEYQLFLQCAGR